MRSNALYFPYIELPDEAWTSRVLLYWDKLSSIVPMDYVDEPSRFSGHMLTLVREGLVEQVIPAHYLYQVNYFEENFIRYIEHRLPRMRHMRLTLRQRRDRIHVEKLGKLPHWLQENGLAEQDGYPWMLVDDWVARAFMAYLASSLGGIKEVDAAPITNDVGISRLFGAVSHNVNTEREFLLGRLLPMPKEKPSISSLIKFKEKHGHLLPPFRERIELLSRELGTIRDTHQRLARAEVVINELKESVQEIEAAMKVNWKHITFGTFVPLLGAGGSFYATDPDKQMVAASAAGLTFVSALYQTINSYRTRVDTLNNNSLAYLAYARQYSHRMA